MVPATCDLCDAHEALLADGRLQILDPGYLALGRRAAFAGPAHTLKVPDDNSLVRQALEQPGHGQVLVVDGGGSRRCALLGGNLATLAARHHWAGVIVHGCVRDRAELDAAMLGIRALAVHPRKSHKRGAGERQLTLRFGGVTIHPGDWIYADADGVLVARQPLVGAAPAPVATQG